MKPIKLKINTKTKKYSIIIGSNLGPSFAKIVKNNSINFKQCLLIVDKKVSKRIVSKIKKSLSKKKICIHYFEANEINKSFKSIDIILNILLKKNFSREDCVISIGGGITGDISGFAASLFKRGLKFINIPTTLLSQVDSSIGGKCGINHKLGKNLIGSFKHPNLVLIDISVLKSLPKREFLAGMAEVIKYGLIKNKTFFNFLNNNYKKIYRLDEDYIVKVVTTCASTKAKIVKDDELEGGIRALLNFGHTFGHAIEASKNYKGILHGEAVSIGMNIASAISADQDLISHEDYCEIEDMILRLGLPTQIPKKITSVSIMKHLGHDKKKVSGKNRFILLNNIGSAFISDKLEK